MRIFLFSILLCLLPLFLWGQKIDTAPLKGLKIRNIGPAGMSGRVTAIDVDLSDPDIIYAGTASGGLWKSVNGGTNWIPVFDGQPVQSIGAVAINQRNPSVIWAGTGEGNPRNSHNSGEGIFKSLDGGKTWTCMGLKETRTIHRIIVHRDNPDVVYVGALGSIWGPNPERGIFRTRDGGKTWEKILFVNDATGCADLVVDPTNPDKLIAAMWEFGRKPWTFNSGGPGSGLYITHDGGDTWERRSDKDGLPGGDLGRLGLAIAASKPNIVYALVEAKENGLYKSTDGGRKWQLVSTRNIGNRPFYYADIFVDPKNENRIYNLFSLVTRSEDGGKSFETLLPYSGVHPDHHAFWIHPEDPNYLINGNDGGLNISRDGGTSWRFAGNIPVGQFYHVNYDMAIPYNVGGGLQDNGSWVGPSAVWKEGGITNYDWQEVFFGDGFDVAFRPDNNRFVYAMSQGGNLGYIDRETGDSRFVRPVHPDDVGLRFNWNAALAQDPFSPCGIYYGSQFLHYSDDCGKNWQILSPDLTTNDPEKQQQEKSGGLTIDDTQAENHTTILAIAPSPADRNVIWVGTDDGNLQLTRDRGQRWTNLAGRIPGLKPGSWIPYIEVSQKNAGEAFVVVNDYRRNDWRPMVYHTADFGQTWKRIADENRVHGYALSIVQDPVEPSLLWLGTDYGLYFSIDAGNTWNKWMNDYPSVPTADLKIHPREHDLIVGTFGRALYILDDIRPFRAIAQSKGKVLEQPFRAFEAPEAYLATLRSYQGLHFPADAEFRGENRPEGALLTVWVKPEKEEQAKETMDKNAAPEEKKKKSPDKIKVQVIDSKGDTIRTFTQKAEPGINRFTWSLNRDGVRFPARREARPDADPPGGRSVLPGVYKLLFSYGDHRDSTLLTVHPDPRLNVRIADLQTREELLNDYENIIKAATEGFDRLMEAGKTIKLVNEALVNAPDSTKKEVAKWGKALQDSLSALEKSYMQPEDLKGIQRTGDNLSFTLFGARRYLSDVQGEPSQMARLSLEKARKHTREVLEKVNAFFEKDFADYQKKVEQVQFSLFKPFAPVKMD